MKPILLKTLYSFLISYVIFNIFSLANGYAQPISTLIGIGMLHVVVLLIGLLALKAKSNPRFRILPHWILIVLFSLFAFLTWFDRAEGNDFFMIPLSIVIAQGILLVVAKRGTADKGV